MLRVLLVRNDDFCWLHSHDALVQWADERRELDEDDEELKALFMHPSTQELVEWLEEEDDEEDDDEEDDED